MSIPHHSTHTSALAKLLAQGVSKSDAAQLLQITPSAVTQLAPPPSPATARALPKSVDPVEGTSSDNSHPLDDQYDRIEKKLLDQLERTTPLLMRPMEISRVLQTINAAKRRGGPLTQSNEAPKILQLNLPIAIQTRFVLNANNQVVSAGAQQLVTLQSSNVAKLLEESKNAHQIAQEDEFGFPISNG